MDKTTAFATLELLNENHKPSVYGGGFCSCGRYIEECTIFLMLELMNYALVDDIKSTEPTRELTEYGYLYDGSPCWSPTSNVGGGWGYSEAVNQRREASLWAVPYIVGPVIERTVLCYDAVPGEWRAVGSSI